MIIEFLKKYWFFIVLFSVFQLFLYLNQLNLKNPIAYFNFVIYFITFLLIGESLSKTRFNKQVIYIFYLFYGYLSIFLSLTVLTRKNPDIDYYVFLYSDVIVKFFILLISFYLVLFSVKSLQLDNNK